jgi:hypothetical protein
MQVGAATDTLATAALMARLLDNDKWLFLFRSVCIQLFSVDSVTSKV